MLSKTHEYALRAVTFLAGRRGCAAAADLVAEKTKVPRRYLTRVLQDLVAAGLVTSRSGPRGGYELAAGAEQLTILDIVNAVAPLERIRSCPLGLTSHTELCPLHAELDKAYAATETALRRVTIEELVNSTSPIVPIYEVACQRASKMTCDLDSRVPDWLIDYPATAPVFEAYGLYTSCGGKSVSYLCASLGLAVEAVHQRLLAAIADEGGSEQDDCADK